MKVGDKITVMVAEPWDFECSMGKNKVTGVVCDYTVTKYGDTYLLRSDESFDIKSLKVQYMVLTHRHKELSPEDFNGAYIPDECINQFNDLNLIKDKIIPIIIGSIQ